jgi:hypothetical protein
VPLKRGKRKGNALNLCDAGMSLFPALQALASTAIAWLVYIKFTLDLTKTQG